MHPDAFFFAAKHVYCKAKIQFLQSCALIFAAKPKGDILYETMNPHVCCQAKMQFLQLYALMFATKFEGRMLLASRL